MAVPAIAKKRPGRARGLVGGITKTIENGGSRCGGVGSVEGSRSVLCCHSPLPFGGEASGEKEARNGARSPGGGGAGVASCSCGGGGGGRRAGAAPPGQAEAAAGAAPASPCGAGRVPGRAGAGRPAPPRVHLGEAGLAAAPSGGGLLGGRRWRGGVGLRDAALVGGVHRHGPVLRAVPRGHARAALRARGGHRQRPHLGEVPRPAAPSVAGRLAARVPARRLQVVVVHPVLVGHVHLLRPLLPRQLLHAARPLLLRLPVQRRLVGVRRGRHRLGDRRAVRRRSGQEDEAPGRGAGVHHLVRRPELPGVGRRAQPRQQQHLLRVPRSGALRRPLLLLPRRPPRPAQRHQLPHLRPGPGLGVQLRRRVAFPDAAAAGRPDEPVLRRDGRRHLRGWRGPRHPQRGVGRGEEGRRDPRLWHEPDHPRHPGVQGGGRGAEQAARRAAAREHGPVRLLLQLDGGHGGRPEAGGAVRRVCAAGAAGEELRDRRGARREVHRAAGGRVARGVGHRQHPAAGAPLGVRPPEPLAQVPADGVHHPMIPAAGGRRRTARLALVTDHNG